MKPHQYIHRQLKPAECFWAVSEYRTVIYSSYYYPFLAPASYYARPILSRMKISWSVLELLHQEHLTIVHNSALGLQICKYQCFQKLERSTFHNTSSWRFRMDSKEEEDFCKPNTVVTFSLIYSFILSFHISFRPGSLIDPSPSFSSCGLQWYSLTFWESLFEQTSFCMFSSTILGQMRSTKLWYRNQFRHLHSYLCYYFLVGAEKASVFFQKP